MLDAEDEEAKFEVTGATSNLGDGGGPALTFEPDLPADVELTALENVPGPSVTAGGLALLAIGLPMLLRKRRRPLQVQR